MSNLGETKPLNIILEMNGDKYELVGGGGGPLPPECVGTEQIIDGAVEEEDLHDDVKGRMTITHDSSTGGLRLGGYAKPGNVPANNSQDVGQGGGEDSDDETGFENGAVDGENDI